ncbi:MFS transporter [Arthrobacter liuii]|uniref:ABC transporter permease n=1 Tax=Arthrobacter liuii TaxID=1476996 RepID=A0ABQ2AYP4_9MICC|nr:MFS transporter [Arthrobacter liuii]GGI02376.1 ABC transporter permease [Arthrobacter liuii]
METPNTPAMPLPAGPKLSKRMLLAAGAGHAVEAFDFLIFSLFAVYLSHSFFPPGNDALALINTTATFALSFFFRPLGGLLFGRLADRRGRRPALMGTVLLMSGSSLVMALLPGYETIGWGAPILLLIARCLQGIAAGGEVGNSFIYLYERAPKGAKGRHSFVIYLATGTAVLVGSLLGFVISTNVSADAMNQWGWRIPFIIGAVLGLVVLYLRRQLHETEEFTARSKAPATKTAARGSVGRTLREHPKPIAQLFFFSGAASLSFYAISNALKIYIGDPHGPVRASSSDSFLALTVATIVYLALLYPFGALADKIGLKKQTIIALGIIAVSIVPLTLMLNKSLPNLILVLVLAHTGLAMLTAISPMMIAQLLPVELRGTGVGAFFNTANALFGGTALFVLTLLSSQGLGWVFYAYVAVMCLVALTCVVGMRTAESSRSAPAEKALQAETVE